MSRRGERGHTQTSRTSPFIVDCLAQKYRGWNAADDHEDGPRVLLEVPVDRWLLGGLRS
jgi:hypothetical protein